MELLFGIQINTITSKVLSLPCKCWIRSVLFPTLFFDIRRIGMSEELKNMRGKTDNKKNKSWELLEKWMHKWKATSILKHIYLFYISYLLV